MSPVFPVFHIVVTVRIGLKTKLELEHPFHDAMYMVTIIARINNCDALNKYAILFSVGTLITNVILVYLISMF